MFGERITDPLLWSLNRHSITGAFGAGIAIAFIPLPVHTIVAVLAALYWRLNLPVMLASTWVVNPFTMVPFYYGAYRLGTMLLHAPPHHFAFQLSWRWLEHGLGPLWRPFLLGCLVSAVVFGLLGRWGLELVWRSAVRRKYRLRHLHRRAVNILSLAQNAVVELEHAVHACGEPRVVRHDHQAGAQLAIELEHQREHLLGVAAVEIAGGLVGQHQPRRGHQRARHRRALPLAARELVRPMAQPSAEPDALEQLRGRAPRRARPCAAPAAASRHFPAR